MSEDSFGCYGGYQCSQHPRNPKKGCCKYSTMHINLHHKELPCPKYNSAESGGAEYPLKNCGWMLLMPQTELSRKAADMGTCPPVEAMKASSEHP